MSGCPLASQQDPTESLQSQLTGLRNSIEIPARLVLVMTRMSCQAGVGHDVRQLLLFKVRVTVTVDLAEQVSQDQKACDSVITLQDSTSCTSRFKEEVLGEGVSIPMSTH